MNILLIFGIVNTYSIRLVEIINRKSQDTWSNVQSWYLS